MSFLFKIILVIKTLENFPTAFLDKFGFVKGNIIYKIKPKNLQFLARAGTEDMAEIVVVTSGYEYNTEKIRIPSRPTIVDLGGHIGTFSIYIAKKYGNKCKIYTFEPDKENYSLLLRNIKLNKITSIYPKNVAISNYVGEGYLEKENISTDAYHLSRRRKSFNCKVSTLAKELDNKKIDLMKIDIEGEEYKLFLDNRTLNFIKENVHYVFLEVHQNDKGHNYVTLKNTIEGNFRIIQRRRNILTLENLEWRK